MNDATIQEKVVEEKVHSDNTEGILKQSSESNKKTQIETKPLKLHKAQVEAPQKENNMFVRGAKTAGRFIVEHPIESLEIAGVVIGGTVKAISFIKGNGSDGGRGTVSTPGSSKTSVTEKVADIVEKASKSLPSENDVTGHRQRYHTKTGVVWKDKASYHRGGK